MATYSHFEDLDIWKDARVQCNLFWRLVRETDLGKDYKLRDQMNGSSGSVMDNIAEGFDRENNKEFINFLAYAHASNSEFRSQMHRCADRGYMTGISLDKSVLKNEELSRKIRGLIKYLRSSAFRGGRYKPSAQSTS